MVYNCVGCCGCIVLELPVVCYTSTLHHTEQGEDLICFVNTQSKGQFANKQGIAFQRVCLCLQWVSL